MICPDFLKKDDIIGITALSMGITDKYDIKRFQNACKNLNDLGYRCLETDNVRKNEKFVSSSAEERVREFEALWKNKDVSLILSVSGGEFLMEMLPLIDESVIKSIKPKWVQGYSDVSLLLYYLTTKFNILTIHSVNAKAFGMEKLDTSIVRNLEILQGNREVVQESFNLYQKDRYPDTEYLAGYNLTEEVTYKSLYSGGSVKITGRVIGGCVDVLSILLGTKYDNTKTFINQFNEGMLWYLDNCELTIMSFYRTVWQMKQNGWFNNANGILIGRTAVNKKVWDLEYEDVLHKLFDDLNIPVIYDIDVGHLPPQWTMINGSLGEFNYINGKGYLVQKID